MLKIYSLLAYYRIVIICIFFLGWLLRPAKRAIVKAVQMCLRLIAQTSGVTGFWFLKNLEYCQCACLRVVLVCFQKLSHFVGLNSFIVYIDVCSIYRKNTHLPKIVYISTLNIFNEYTFTQDRAYKGYTFTKNRPVSVFRVNVFTY